MLDFWSRLFDTSDFPARWNCGHWTAGHGWLHILSDLGVWSAYVTIPCVLGYFAWRRRDIPFRPVFWLFAAFILACGTTHLLEAAIFWWPAYRLAGLVKFITAVVSWGTILALVRIAPQVLALRSPENLEREVAERTAALAAANESLRGESAERLRAQESLRGSDQRFARFMQHLPGLAWIKDSAGRYEYINDAAEKAFRVSRAQLYGKTDSEVFPEETAVQFQSNDQEVLTSGAGKRMVETLQHADGLHYSLVSKFCIPGPDGHGLLIGGMAIDITDQKLAEDELRRARAELEGRVRQRTAELAAANAGLVRENEERRRAEAEMTSSEQRYRSLVEATTAIVWNTPASGEFETEQAGWSRFTGQTFDQLRGWGWLDAVHPDDRPRTASVWSASVASRSLYQVEHRLRRHDGAYRHMLARAVPILAENGAIREWVGVHTDIDTEKRAEVALRDAKEAAEAANRSKSEFLANMSHEIRTPMNGILGMTELMLDMEISSRQREYLDMIKGSADCLLAVINDLLDFSKIEAGKMELDPVDFNLAESVGDTLKLLALRAAHKKGLELACRIEPELPAILVGDAGRLRQILINLVGNAVKFTEHGEVVVNVRTEDRHDEGLRLHFSVRDTGIGIPAAKQQSIFDPFTQADGSVTRTYGGTGLGLPISAKLVELMGGRLWVESEPGKGSTFHFTARFGQAQDSVAPPPSSRLVNLENVRVLVVDDNATNRAVLEEMLLGWRMQPSVVEAGPAALVELEQAADSGRPYSLVLLDALMPEMDGFTVAERIRQHPRLTGATVLMLSSVDLPRRAERCRELGLAGYVVKPIRQTELRAAVCRALDVPAEKRQGRPSSGATGEAPPPAGLRLLVAEDNVVNQAVVRRMLEKEGHQAEVVGNGKEALAALERQSFDLVLMDIQMPEMGGLEATAAIRAGERGTGRHIPIIALTACAIKGDRERCLEAGMDGYLSKPIERQELRRALSSLSRGNAAAETTAAPQRASPDVVLDWQATLERYRGDIEFVRTIAGLVLKDYPKALEEIRSALAQDDSAGVGRIAHMLAGAVSSFAAPKATAAAMKLEALGNAGAVRDAVPAVAALEEELARLNGALAEAVASTASPGCAQPGVDSEKSKACTP